MAILILLLTLGFALSPLATDGFNGFTPDQFPVVQADWPIQPAPWAFSIWGLIYGGLIAHAVFGLLRRRKAPGWSATRPALAISLGVGIFWIAAAQASPLLATAMILVMAAAAIAALLRAGIADPAWLTAPLGLYAGWLTAATGVAIGVTLSGYGLLGPRAAALVMLPLVLATALVAMRRRPDAPTYPLAVGWALFGIAMDNPDTLPVAALAAAGLALLSALLLRGARG